MISGYTMGGVLHIILVIALVVVAVQVIQGPKRVQVFGPLGDMNDMANHGEDMNEERENARSKADFIRLAGIGPELAEFVTEFVEKPDHFYSIPFEKRREIENQMDAVLLSFERW